MNNEKEFVFEWIKRLKGQYPCFYKIILWIVVIVLFLLPFTIWVLYTLGHYKVIIPTDYTAGELLSYYGYLMGSLGTVVLGIATIYLNKKSNDINKRLVELEKCREKPRIEVESCNISYTEEELGCRLGSAFVKFINHGGVAEKVKLTLERIGFSDDNIINVYYYGERFSYYAIEVFKKKEYFLYELLVKSDEQEIGLDIVDKNIIARELFLVEGIINYRDIYNKKTEKYLILFYEKNDEKRMYEYCNYRLQDKPMVIDSVLKLAYI